MERMSDGQRMNLFVVECHGADRVRCAKKTGIAESTISRIISGKSSMGRSVMHKIMIYCSKNNSDHGKYTNI